VRNILVQMHQPKLRIDQQRGERGGKRRKGEPLQSRRPVEIS
jgi:hypothetical protein